VQRRHHYELALEHYLRSRRLPYVAVDEARKALVPLGSAAGSATAESASLKSFDLVLYGQATNLLVEVKGRRFGARLTTPATPSNPAAPRPAWRNSRLDSWATEEDVRCLLEWERLFGAGFRAAFVFVYWCESQPPAPLFEEVLEFKDRWYVVRVAMAREYAQVMKPRSPKWRTVHVPGAAFDRLSRNLCGSLAGEPTASAAAGSLYTPPRPQ
jgi:hypothetical protein